MAMLLIYVCMYVVVWCSGRSVNNEHLVEEKESKVKAEFVRYMVFFVWGRYVQG